MENHDYWISLEIEKIGGFDLSIHDWTIIHATDNYLAVKDSLKNPIDQLIHRLNAIKKYLKK